MQYQPLGEYTQSWVFRHREMPVAESLMADIKPLSESSAMSFWKSMISKEATHASHFLGDDWAARNGVWDGKGEWQGLWESDETALPEELMFSDWENNTQVFFCYDHLHVIQTSWATFKACWKNFLFYDDEPILIAKKRAQVARFHSDGTFDFGKRPL